MSVALDMAIIPLIKSPYLREMTIRTFGAQMRTKLRLNSSHLQNKGNRSSSNEAERSTSCGNTIGLGDLSGDIAVGLRASG